VLQDKDTRDKLAAVGFDVNPTRAPEEFARYVADQHAHWGRMIGIAQVRPE
jgi:tripartite-type tricarboxylate transporter receptor subunit TctC